jgi:hypothetical protein
MAATTLATNCPDCGAAIGEPHRGACEIERCLVTGESRQGCDLAHICVEDVWDGEVPGTAECREYGWWRGGVPDLMRLRTAGYWDRDARRWVRRAG